MNLRAVKWTRDNFSSVKKIFPDATLFRGDLYVKSHLVIKDDWVMCSEDDDSIQMLSDGQLVDEIMRMVRHKEIVVLTADCEGGNVEE